MTGMPDITEGINDPYIEAGEMRHGLFRQIAHVGRIGEIPEPKPERFATPVALAKRYRLDHSARAVDADHLAGADVVGAEHGGIFAAGGRLEAIGEAPAQDLPGRGIVIDVDPPPPVIRDHAQIIDCLLYTSD